MNIPPGYETIPQRAKRTGEPESTIRYKVKTGKLPYKRIKLSVTVLPVDALPLE